MSSDELLEQVKRELARIAELPVGEQTAAYAALHALLEQALDGDS
ncbi:unannotated protein [freshwater metagenome]|jgi:DNA-binding transcriptional regulator YbjK|uniref:Unannotated protein n=1 Tax=freshwater metagenome TaxID=449393 RepID=A0A6J7L886_9ZZZZ